MSFVQRVIVRLLPRRLAERVEAESRAWMMRCSSGHERSVWAAGGIRAGAAGNPRRLARCPECGAWRWHTLYRR